MLRRLAVLTALLALLAGIAIVVPTSAHAWAICYVDTEPVIVVPPVYVDPNPVYFPCPTAHDQPPETASPVVVIDTETQYYRSDPIPHEPEPGQLACERFQVDWHRVQRGGRAFFHNNTPEGLPDYGFYDPPVGIRIYRQVSISDCHYWPTILADSGLVSFGEMAEINGVSNLPPDSYLIMLYDSVGREDYWGTLLVDFPALCPEC